METITIYQTPDLREVPEYAELPEFQIPTKQEDRLEAMTHARAAAMRDGRRMPIYLDLKSSCQKKPAHQ